jgi:hypothetical protein
MWSVFVVPVAYSGRQQPRLDGICPQIPYFPLVWQSLMDQPNDQLQASHGQYRPDYIIRSSFS